MEHLIANAKKNYLSKIENANKYYIENYSVDMNNKNSSHTVMVQEALGSERILDVGCGAGVIGKKIKELQKCCVDGIEVDKVAAALAKKVLDKVYVMPIDDENNKAYQGFMKNSSRYDAIICADIIEHLVDPGKTLFNLSKKLSPNGKILISIPNLSHIDVIAGLIDNRFNYNRVGILDSTHLRFWTENSFYEFIANVNEAFNTTFIPRLITKTTAIDDSVNAGFLEEICGKELYTFQNIFELTLSKQPYTPKLKKYHNYEKLLRMGEELKKLREEVKQKDEIIRGMEESASWKITEPLRKINAKFKK